MGPMSNIKQMSASSKRKIPMEPISIYSTLEQQSLKQMAQMQHRPWLQQMPPPNKRIVQLESVPCSPGSHNSPTSYKKTTEMDSFSNKSGSQRSLSDKSHSYQMHVPSKVVTYSSESVRSKMREQLAAAFSLVNQQETKPSYGLNNCSSEGNHLHGERADLVTKASHENVPSGKKKSKQENDKEQGEAQNILVDIGSGDSTLTSICDGSEFQSCKVLSNNDVSFSEKFFVKDKLMGGNRHSWILESDVEIVGRKKTLSTEKQKSGHEDGAGDMLKQTYQSSQNLAFKIEAELFKLFGCVNKKYKEKGRSLLFNLKDRNNPELRDRVMRGEISPERLCSMNAEELASKELSEWRMAKAEELAHMVILQESDVDIRRLVRKTHKGEFQVEVEQDNNLPMDISCCSSSVDHCWPKRMKEFHTSKSDRDKDDLNALGDHITSSTFTIIPSCESNDLIEGLMVDDGLKDAELLPPIVSLDEFMESLDSEPPFDNLPLDDSQRAPISVKVDFKAGTVSKCLDLSPKDADASSKRYNNIKTIHTNTNYDVKPVDSHFNSNSNSYASSESRENLVLQNSKESLVNLKSNHSLLKPETSLLGRPKGEHVWGGLVQLNVSTTATVIVLFKSGEKTSVNKWPGLLQIKGRVRLDAFEKFLQEVPLSRTRAVMVVHFVLKDQSSENESTALREVADSYILDDRVGFSEPVAGVELYFCPPHYKTVNILGKIIQKEHMDALNAIDNGLIGVIVWRKLSTISPKSSSQKHILKKQHMTSRMLQDSAPKSNLIAKQALPRDLVATNSKSSSTDHEDDIPPGFGPPASKGEEDDLPEFNFSSGLNPPTRNNFTRDLSRGSVPIHHPASRPVEQVRELIHKYGQNNTSTIPPGNWKYKGVRGFGGQPWNDDDDFPEWQPHVPTQQARNLQQQMLTPHMLNQAHFGLACQQPIHQAMQPTLNGPENMASWQNQQQHGTWRVPPVQGNGLLPCNLGCQLSVWQMYGASGHGIFGQPGIDCEQNTPPKSRGV